MNSSQIRNILAAGTLTGMVMIMFFVFGGRVLKSEAAESTAVDSLETQNVELSTAVQTFQTREAAFQQQIEAANQSIQQLQGDADLSQTEYEAVLATLQAEGGDLEATLVTIQDRETQYRSMIEEANSTIQQLETDANGLQTQYQTDVQTLQNQNAELVQLVQLMQQRELQYQGQIELANQTILDLQNSIGQASNNDGNLHEEHDDDHDDHDDDDDDHDDHEDDDDDD